MSKERLKCYTHKVLRPAGKEWDREMDLNTLGREWQDRWNESTMTEVGKKNKQEVK